jgi:hypothetical protein
MYYNVSTVEVKCPFSFDAAVPLFLCNTPDDVKKENKAYYHQILFQMEVCDSLVGYLVVYQPMFKANKMKVVEFRKKDLISEFKLLKERKESAIAKYNEIRNKLLGV